MFYRQKVDVLLLKSLLFLLFLAFLKKWLVSKMKDLLSFCYPCP